MYGCLLTWDTEKELLQEEEYLDELETKKY